MLLRNGKIERLLHDGDRFDPVICVHAESQVQIALFQQPQKVERGPLGKLEAQALVFRLLV